MRGRPTSVTVIAWLLIIGGALNLPWTLTLLYDPKVKELMARDSSLPIPVQYFHVCAGLLMVIVTGVAMLKAQNWARMLYVTWSLISLLLLFTTSPIRPILMFACVPTLIIVFFLFRPDANRYFHARRTRQSCDGRTAAPVEKNPVLDENPYRSPDSIAQQHSARRTDC